MTYEEKVSLGLISEAQVRRDQRDQAIANRYAELKASCGDISDTRVIHAIAKEGKMGVTSPCGVRQALIRANVLKPLRRI